MKRVPRDLNDPALRDAYVKNHMSWFLDHHDSDAKEFLRDVGAMYPEEAIQRNKRRRAKQQEAAQDDMFMAK